MSLPKARALSLVCCVGFAAGCAGGTGELSSQPDWDWNEQGFAELAGRWDVPAAVHLGLESSRPDAELSAGDRVLLGMRIEDEGSDEPAEIRYIDVVLREFDVVRTQEGVIIPDLFVPVVDLRVFGATGEVEAEERGLKLALNLPAGVWDGCGPDADRKAWIRGIDNTFSLVGLAADTPALASLLWKVVRKPSLLSLLGGVEVSGAPWLKQAEPAEWAPWPAPARAFPFRLNVNRQAALHATITCVEPVAPLLLTGGIVRLEGREPGESGTHRILLEVVGARSASD